MPTNLHLGVESQGWKIDNRKLRVYLKNKLQIKKAFLFIGYIPKQQKLYAGLTAAGFDLVFKQTSQHIDMAGKLQHKGNVDAELVLHAAAIEYANYNQATVISGDGDFACLYEFLKQNDKLGRIMTPGPRYSHLLRPYADQIIELPDLKTALEYRPKPRR